MISLMILFWGKVWNVNGEGGKQHSGIFSCLPCMINRSLIVISCAVFKWPCHRPLSPRLAKHPCGEKSCVCSPSFASFNTFTQPEKVDEGLAEFSLTDGYGTVRTFTLFVLVLFHFIQKYIYDYFFSGGWGGYP